jgi:plastocyanin
MREHCRAMVLSAAVAGIVFVGVPAEVDAHGSTEAAAKPVVEMVGLRSVPPRLEVSTGTVVTWLNREPADYPLVGGGHEIFSEYYGAFESPNIAPGARWEHRFVWPGTYKYRCRWHPGTTGEVIVTGEPVDDPDEPSAS